MYIKPNLRQFTVKQASVNDFRLSLERKKQHPLMGALYGALLSGGLSGGATAMLNRGVGPVTGIAAGAGGLLGALLGGFGQHSANKEIENLLAELPSEDLSPEELKNEKAYDDYVASDIVQRHLEQLNDKKRNPKGWENPAGMLLTSIHDDTGDIYLKQGRDPYTLGFRNPDQFTMPEKMSSQNQLYGATRHLIQQRYGWT